jgi:hypothetical protein
VRGSCLTFGRLCFTKHSSAKHTALYEPKKNGKNKTNLVIRDLSTQEEYETFIAKHTYEQRDPHCLLRFIVTKEWSINAGLVDILHGEGGRERSVHGTIEGGPARRRVIRK